MKHHVYWQEFAQSGLLYKKRYELIRQLMTTSSMMSLWKLDIGPQPAEIPLIRAPTEIPHNVINIFTDGSKIGGKVGAAVVIIKDDIVLHQSKYKLHERCSNNQAEQVAILKVLEQIQSLQLAEDAEKIVLVNTDSKVTLDTL